MKIRAMRTAAWLTTGLLMASGLGTSATAAEVLFPKDYSVGSAQRWVLQHTDFDRNVNAFASASGLDRLKASAAEGRGFELRVWDADPLDQAAVGVRITSDGRLSVYHLQGADGYVKLTRVEHHAARLGGDLDSLLRDAAAFDQLEVSCRAIDGFNAYIELAMNGRVMQMRAAALDACSGTEFKALARLLDRVRERAVVPQ